MSDLFLLGKTDFGHCVEDRLYVEGDIMDIIQEAIIMHQARGDAGLDKEGTARWKWRVVLSS